MDSPTSSLEKGRSLGPYQPTLILHGGAGAITRQNLPPELYYDYRTSLLNYLRSTRDLLDSGVSALEAACHAVCMFEDDPLFNCGRGAVFTTAGTIEMEASVMVSSITASGPPEGQIKRGAAVSLIRNTRHPILLAKEVLVHADAEAGRGVTSTMHCHLSGINVENWGWGKKGLERKSDDWFWTKKRWDEHRRGLTGGRLRTEHINEVDGTFLETTELPSQGTVGAVCMDSWGNLCVATSTGGLTNKAPGRIGDTPTIGAGFWAESWNEGRILGSQLKFGTGWDTVQNLRRTLLSNLYDCIPFVSERSDRFLTMPPLGRQPMTERLPLPSNFGIPQVTSSPQILEGQISRRAVALSGTGNGDSFLRTNAARSAAAICRFASCQIPLSQAVTKIAGSGGELQKSAGDRWLKTGEGQGGLIGIDVRSDLTSKTSLAKPLLIAEVVSDFNCGGLWRAWYDVDPGSGDQIPKVMVFKDEY